MAIKLARLPFNWEKQPQLLERYWDRVMTVIEDLFNQLLTLPDIQDAITQANQAAANAQAAATNAQNSADNANTTAESTASRQSLIDSYVTGLTISADSTGSVTISGHTRVYADPLLNPSVSVSGGVLATAAAAGSVIRVYYSQASRAGGSVTYQFTTDPSFPPVQSGTIHSVGAVIIPAAGSQNGKGVEPPGYVNI